MVAKWLALNMIAKQKEFNTNQEILEKFKIPEGMKVQRVLEYIFQTEM